MRSDPQRARLLSSRIKSANSYFFFHLQSRSKSLFIECISLPAFLTPPPLDGRMKRKGTGGHSPHAAKLTNALECCIRSTNVKPFVPCWRLAWSFVCCLRIVAQWWHSFSRQEKNSPARRVCSFVSIVN